MCPVSIVRILSVYVCVSVLRVCVFSNVCVRVCPVIVPGPYVFVCLCVCVFVLRALESCLYVSFCPVCMSTRVSVYRSQKIAHTVL